MKKIINNPESQLRNLIITIVIIYILFLLLLFTQGVTIKFDEFDFQITSSIGSIMAGIFGPLVSFIAVFIYFQALKQDKELFIKKEEINLYQVLYIKLITLFYEFLKRGNIKGKTLFDSLMKYKEINDPDNYPDIDHYKEKRIERFNALGEDKEKLFMDIDILKSKYYTVYQPLLQEIKCLTVRVTEPTIRFNLEVLVRFYDKLLLAIDDVMTIKFQKNCLFGFRDTQDRSLKLINELILLGVAPEIHNDKINEELKRLKLQ